MIPPNDADIARLLIETAHIHEHLGNVLDVLARLLPEGHDYANATPLRADADDDTDAA